VKYLLLLGCSLIVASPAWAQADITCPHPDDVVITCDPPARPPRDNPEPVEAITAQDIVIAEPVPDQFMGITVIGRSDRLDLGPRSVSVITAEELARIQGPDITRAIERLPGVSLARSGGLGSQTSLFVRGASSESLLVLIDGIPVEDAAAPSGGFDLGTLTASGLRKIELLRGPNSLAWGSNAVGGVLALTSDDSGGERAAIEYGAHGTLDAQTSIGLHDTDYGVGVSAGYTSSDGISAFAGGKEADPFRQWRIAGRGQIDVGGNITLQAAGRYADSKIDFDGFPPPTYTFADTAEYQTTRQGSGRVGLSYWSSGLSLSGGVAHSDTRRAYFDPAFGSAANFQSSGQITRAEMIGQLRLGNTWQWTLDFGADSNWTSFSTTFDPHQSARLSGAHLIAGFEADKIKLSAGVRLDDHDRFGSHWTLGSSARFDLDRSWRIVASWSQGFKAPTLSQLYGYGGNATLKPETSNGFEAGLEYGQRNGDRHLALTLFRRDNSNLIDYLSPTGYFNVSRTRAQGGELEGQLQVEQLRLSAAYTYLDVTDRSNGKDLARRPRHLATLSADWQTPLHALSLGADLRLVGDSFDDRANLTRLSGYGLLTLRASVPLGTHLELYGRVENMTDKAYQTVAGYGTYGRSAYGGVRVKW
jgi:vitamin B12 transporter